MRNTLGVRTESTGWRDSWISDKHRSWGYDLPASDIDFMLLEYDNMKPITLVEHKTVGCWKQFGRETVLRWHAPTSSCILRTGNKRNRGACSWTQWLLRLGDDSDVGAAIRGIPISPSQSSVALGSRV
jgi:hypothetical protein